MRRAQKLRRSHPVHQGTLLSTEGSPALPMRAAADMNVAEGTSWNEVNFVAVDLTADFRTVLPNGDRARAMRRRCGTGWGPREARRTWSPGRMLADLPFEDPRRGQRVARVRELRAAIAGEGVQR